MAILFGVAALLQLNDPDPLRWISIYASASALAAYAALTSRVPILATCTLGAVALVWGLSVSFQFDRRILPGELFYTWKMYDQRAELAREAGGLFITVAWSVASAIRALMLNRRKRSANHAA
ncbi:MAG: transmembrane 220 family protein [Vicinamibacterales bacterium]